MTYPDPKTVKTPEVNCPKCNASLDSATSVGLNTPSVGDFSVCLYCQSILRFGLGLVLEQATEADVPDELKAKLKAIQKAARKKNDLFQ